VQLRQHFNEDPGIAGEMSVRFDVATGQVRAYGAGFWSPRQAKAYFQDWEKLIREIHAQGIAVSALVDMGDGQVQSSEVAAIIASVTSDKYRPGDAIAMLVPNSLAKIQMRRVLDARYHEYFISRSAAETWLKGRAPRRLLAAG
jgi:hypothetical protein